MANAGHDHVTVRRARAGDAAGCAAVYAPYVRDTAISFEEVPPDAEQMAARIRRAHVWLVAERAGAIAGFAYGDRHQERAAYRWTADVSVYVELAHRSRGIGRALYGELFEQLRAAGVCMLCAGITEPNHASIALHRAFGFVPVGTYRSIGFKHGRWHDVHWMQLDLRADGAERPPPAAPQ